MPEPTTANPTFASRERAIATACAVLFVLFRSAVLVFWEESRFDADQAVMGLAAKHLSELRAWPLFFYGSNHILAVEAWMAAPMFLIFGVTVTALKLPLLAINIAVAVLLMRALERDAGLRPWLAALASSFFTLMAPGTAAHLLDASGGNLEPFLYALLLWVFRARPVIAGLVFGIGFLHREFTLYAFVALLAIEARNRTLFTREGVRRRLAMLRTVAEVWLVVQLLKPLSSAAGPGTTIADLHRAHSNLQEVSDRICFDASQLPMGVWRLITIHWPRLFGVHQQPVLDFSIDGTVNQGMPFGGLLLGGAVIALVWGVLQRVAAERRWRPQYDLCAYLVLIGLFSSAGLIMTRCGQIDPMRYELLSVLGAVGLMAWFLVAQPPQLLRRIGIGLVCATVAVGTVASGRLLTDYLAHRHRGEKRLIARHLEVRGIKYAISDYWLAYALTFLTQERVIVASEDYIRINQYQFDVEGHQSEAIRISRKPCANGEPVAGVYFCKYE